MHDTLRGQPKALADQLGKVILGKAEVLESLAPGALPAPLRDDLARAVLCFYRARYGGERPPAQELDGLLGRLPAA